MVGLIRLGQAELLMIGVLILIGYVIAFLITVERW
jgi:hypothetical protein